VPPPVSPLAVPPAIVNAPVVSVENPVFLPTGDRQAAWEQIVDVVQQFGFKVDREQPVRQIGDVLTEGRLDTYPRVGATVLEPWRSDSASRQQRLEATLQSIQRRVTLIVRPANGGLLVDVAVLREREVLDRAEFSTTGAGAFRRGDRSPRNVGSAGFAAPRTIAWVPLGRDPALEQSLVAELKSRFGGSWPAYAAPAPSIPAETMQAPEPQRLPPTNPVN